MISAIASLSGHKLVRINLSEHSELSDLLGNDLPVSSTAGEISDSVSPQFSWCDGVFLKAMKAGDWVLLDELNLAPQTVLEGLNACFDHRQRVFIPEIGQAVDRPDSFRVFCTQNPMSEGGGRKGLPQSFLSRLTRVFVEPLTDQDLIEIAQQAFKAKTTNLFVLDIAGMVGFVRALQDAVVLKGIFGQLGGPWEFNIRDIMRWCELMQQVFEKLFVDPVDGSSYQQECREVYAKKIFSECCYFLCKNLFFI